MVLVVVSGVLVALVSGFVWSMPGDSWIPENKFYGFPLVWRTIDQFKEESYHYFEFGVDCIFWISMVWIMTVSAKISRGWAEKKRPQAADTQTDDSKSAEHNRKAT
jgi:hypothetical protein